MTTTENKKNTFESRPANTDLISEVIRHVSKMLQIDWNPQKDGLPVLTPNYLTPRDVHLLGKGVDLVKQEGGIRFLTISVPPQGEEHMLVSLSQGVGRPCSVLVSASGKFNEVISGFPRTWRDGTSILHGWIHEGEFLYADGLGHRGKSLFAEGMGYQQRLAWCSLPTGIRQPRKIKWLESYNREVRKDQREKALDIESKQKALEPREGLNQKEWKSLGEDIKQDKIEAPISNASHNLYTKLVLLDQVELRVRAIPYAVYPEFPTPIRGSNHFWIRAHCDYTNSATVSGPSESSRFYHVPVSEFIYLFRGKPSLSDQKIQLWIEDELNSIHAIGIRTPTLGHVPDDAVVACLRTPQGTYSVYAVVHHRTHADTRATHDNTRMAQDSKLDMSYLDEVWSIVSTIDKDLKTPKDIEMMNRLLILAPGLDNPRIDVLD